MADKRILIVEDERAVSEELYCILESLGYEVCGIANSGEEAVGKVFEAQPDLVLIGTKLQKQVDRVEAAEHIRIHMGIPVVYYTAYNNEGNLQRAQQIETFGYLVKPFEDRELHATIEMAFYKHHIETKLIQNKRWLNAILEGTEDAIIVIDIKKRVIFMNPSAEALTGWKQDESPGKVLEEVWSFSDAGSRKFIERIDTESLQWGEGVDRDKGVLVINKRGTEVCLEYNIMPVRDNGAHITCFVLIFHDITKCRQLEKEILEVSDKEQQRIGRDLHDGLGQQMTGLSIMSKVLERELAAKSLIEADYAGKIAKLANQAVDQISNVLRGLNNVEPTADGFVLGLQELASDVESLFHVQCSFENEVSIPIDNRVVAKHLYRIAQEAVNNTIKHAHAKHIWIGLASKDRGIILTVKDDGAGIPRVLRAHGMGLHIMHYRANIIGASVSIEQNPGGGTVVTCSLQGKVKTQE